MFTAASASKMEGSEEVLGESSEGELVLVNSLIVHEGNEGCVVSVTIHGWKNASLLKRAIKKASEGGITVPAKDLVLILAKTEGGWLPSSVILDYLQSANIPEEVQNMLNNEVIDPTAEIDDLFQGAPRSKTIHVLVVVPEAPTPIHPAIVFLARPANPLVSSAGSHWDFQKPSNLQEIASAIPRHFTAWTRRAYDKQSHPLFLCLDGPGTGKSRLLNEFPMLVNDILKGHENTDMVSLLQNAFTFNITFENGTTSGTFADPSLAIGTRMLYQLQNSLPWDSFRLDPAHHVPPNAVLSRLSELKGVPPRKLCVILCVDSLQKLEHQAGSKISPFYCALGTLCELVNASDCWVIAVASATIYEPVDFFFAESSQWHVYLRPPKLSRPTIQNEDVFQGFGREDLVQLLIDDMGGVGRCLEQLFIVMEHARTFDFTAVLKEVAVALRKTYPDITKAMESMREAFLAVVARRRVSKKAKFGDATLDQVISAGLIRSENGILQCPYVLYLILTTEEYPWLEYDTFVPVEARQDVVPWQRWEKFNCKFRALKAMAYAGEPSVRWKDIHYGARFGPGCDRHVREVARKIVLAPNHMSTKSNGFMDGDCTCDRDWGNHVFLNQPASGSPSGDSLCLQDVQNVFFREVHQCKHIDDGSVLSPEAFQVEKEKAVGEDDIFVLFCSGSVSSDIPDSVLKNCAIVDDTCWEAYYGPFAARVPFSCRRSRRRA